MKSLNNNLNKAYYDCRFSNNISGRSSVGTIMRVFNYNNVNIDHELSDKKLNPRIQRLNNESFNVNEDLLLANQSLHENNLEILRKV